MMATDSKVRSLPGPILVIGAGGFVGANLFRSLRQVRDDVYGTVRRAGLWRLDDVPSMFLPSVNLLDPNSLRSLLHRVKAQTVFNCSAFGAYSFETDPELIHRTNFNSLVMLAQMLLDRGVAAFVHAGSSSEYGTNSDSPDEDAPLRPDSHYAVSKGAGSLALSYYGKVLGLPCANLRLYSVYGPYEDSSRLIPTLAWHALRKTLPPLVNPDVSRDFVHVQDACSAFVSAAYAMQPAIHGESYNVGTGTQTTIGELARLAKELFQVPGEPEFSSMPNRDWDRTVWRCNPERAREHLGWAAQIPLARGLEETVRWWGQTLLSKDFNALTKKQRQRTDKTSLSVVVSLKDNARAIAGVHKRITEECHALGLDHEIIFVDRGSRDDTMEHIRGLSERDCRVRGVILSRDFGAESALRSGMELSTKEGCVLIHSLFSDPVSLIPEFIAHWRQGADVVYGRRRARRLSLGMRILHGLFHKLFALLSDVSVPEDAADYCLLDASVVHWVMRCEERDSYLRGIRSYVGFTQVGVEYDEPRDAEQDVPESFWAKMENAKQAIFSFTRLPLTIMTTLGLVCFGGALLLGLATLVQKILSPGLRSPREHPHHPADPAVRHGQPAGRRHSGRIHRQDHLRSQTPSALHPRP